MGTNESVTLNAYDTGTAGAMRKFALCTVGNFILVPVLVRPTVKKKQMKMDEAKTKATAKDVLFQSNHRDHTTTVHYTNNDIYDM